MTPNTYTITNISHTGHGITKHNNENIHILGAFPGDIVEAKIYKKAEGKTYAEIINIIEPSPLREFTPKEKPFYNANAPWESLSIDSENTLKTQIFKNIYLDYHINIPDITTPTNIQTTGYRNKVAYSFMKDTRKKNNLLCFALYIRGTNNQKIQKIPQPENKLIHPVIEKTGKQFLHFFNQNNISEKDLKYLILRYSYFENNVVANILVPETNRKKLPFKKTHLENFLNQNKNIKGILVSSSTANVRSAKIEKNFYELGNINIYEEILGKKYYYHPSLFFQIYPEIFSEILKDARSIIQKEISKEKLFELLDLFAGVGIIGMELSDLALKVTGVELSSLSQKYALQNAGINKIENYNFVEASVDDILGKIHSNQILIVDPARTGLSKETIREIQNKKPKYVIYISCNPVTQKRDIDYIKNSYKVSFIKAYNIFPKTHHIESMVFLKRK